MLGLTTIGNATLIAYDEKPILITDPWFGGEDIAYFGSWNLRHAIPEQQKQDMLKAEYVWMSHGHQDHLNSFSINKLKEKIILLPDHVGQRISNELTRQGFKVQILKDRKWVSLSKNIKILSIADYWQDGSLLVEVNDRLFVNLNDGAACGHLRFIRKIIKQYNDSYLLKAFSYGDADMINLFDEQGERLNIRTSGQNIGLMLSQFSEKLGVNHCIPFSNFHQYQREDSFWANDFITPISAHREKFSERKVKYIEPFSTVDCEGSIVESIHPPEIPSACIDPKKFGDDWGEPLKAEDRKLLEQYWGRKKMLKRILNFINFKVGGIDNFIEIGGPKNKGITFEVPRNSLIKTVKYEVFDDLFAGNFMKTTLHGVPSLHSPPIAAIVGNFADNGRVETEEDFARYIAEYKKRAGWELSQYIIERNLVLFMGRFVPRHSKLFPVLKNIYGKFRLSS
jgi:hypothetical protein